MLFDEDFSSAEVSILPPIDLQNQIESDNDSADEDNPDPDRMTGNQLRAEACLSITRNGEPVNEDDIEDEGEDEDEENNVAEENIVAEGNDVPGENNDDHNGFAEVTGLLLVLYFKNSDVYMYLCIHFLHIYMFTGMYIISNSLLHI